MRVGSHRIIGRALKWFKKIIWKLNQPTNHNFLLIFHIETRETHTVVDSERNFPLIFFYEKVKMATCQFRTHHYSVTRNPPVEADSDTLPRGILMPWQLKVQKSKKTLPFTQNWSHLLKKGIRPSYIRKDNGNVRYFYSNFPLAPHWGTFFWNMESAMFQPFLPKTRIWMDINYSRNGSRGIF